jgi:hypothetical protein
MKSAARDAALAARPIRRLPALPSSAGRDGSAVDDAHRISNAASLFI